MEIYVGGILCAYFNDRLIFINILYMYSELFTTYLLIEIIQYYNNILLSNTY